MYPVTQQYYLRARFYNPVIGRFTQEDTYYGDGLNLYQYCQANPVGYVDPSGHNICPTQLSLYKKYKEFFAKKMPEAEAKKKAYEYMRKKMGLTADNPFTETSKGGTSRNICKGICEPLLEADGLILGGPTFRGRDDKTSYRQFWRK